ncbi:MAG: hypothetical protein R8N23_14335 [Reichenbachiella sp.]|uniref:hypothetical protein n=1 Tax=Reichenbachiella sp. TaxID=2184521 RepID=UPI0029664076|nr:hypothetical protein [Reichenbachiella sp.]MDW3211051.1 hypothetical protein [Reichenbachiella sp.]
MHQQTKLILLFMFLWLVQKAQGQNDDKRAESTILKLDLGRDSYKRSQIRYIERKGFNADSYQWNDTMIDNNLRSALQSRSNSNAFIGVGSFFVLFGMHQLFVSALVEDDEGSAKAKRTGTSLFMLSCVSYSTSIILKSKSKKKIRQAEKLRLEGVKLKSH